MKKLFDLLAANGGKIVSSSSLTELEIAHARAKDRFYVDENGLGFAFIPEKEECNTIYSS